jgi:hypothetical protein
MTRRGEKVGWVGGWTGGFLWLAILAGVWLVQGHPVRAIVSLALFLLAVVSIVTLSPWRHPDRSYRLLMLPTYVILFAAIGHAVAVTGLEEIGLTWWSVFWLFPLLLPLVTAGGRTWNDGAPAPEPEDTPRTDEGTRR